MEALNLSRSTSWYKAGQTPDAVLGEVSSSMEECRAETVALFCTPPFFHSVSDTDGFTVVSNPAILKIFGVSHLRASNWSLSTNCFQTRTYSTPTPKISKRYTISPSCSWLVLA